LRFESRLFDLHRQHESRWRTERPGG
jgi:hypothetical protein